MSDETIEITVRLNKANYDLLRDEDGVECNGVELRLDGDVIGDAHVLILHRSPEQKEAGGFKGRAANYRDE